MYQAVQKFHCLPSVFVSALVLAVAPLIAEIKSVNAQQNIANCKAPNPGEYLLLVNSPTQNNQSQLRRALPTELKTTTCKYLNGTVTRIGGFTKIDDANRWARYVSNVVGLSTTITTRPPQAASQTGNVITRPAAQASSSTGTYKPQKLGQGFAVLVDYYNQPELARQVQQVVGGDVGFVSYGQRPYLSAVYTTNQKEAYNTMQNLSDRGFFTMLVDSRKVLLLRSVVRL